MSTLGTRLGGVSTARGKETGGTKEVAVIGRGRL